MPNRNISVVEPPPTDGDPLLAAAYEVLLDVGPRRTTLTEVARRADVSRMTVYRKYADLPTLLSAVLTAELAELMAQITGNVVGTTDRERIVSMVVAGTKGIAEHPLMVRLLELDPQYLLPIIVDRRGSTARGAEDLLAAALAASDDGSVNAPNPVAVARTIVTAASAWIFSTLALQTGDPAGTRYDEFATMIERYLS